MIRWLRAAFAWRCVHRDQAWSYHENAVTGDRMAVSHFPSGGYVPADFDWVGQRPGLPPMSPAAIDGAHEQMGAA